METLISKQPVAETDKEALHVLLCEDDEQISMLVSDYLELCQFQVTRAHRGDEALQLFKKNNFYDVIVTDLRMAGLTGLELLREVRKENQFVPVILISAHGDKTDAIEALRLGGTDFLEKPINLPQLAKLTSLKGYLYKKEITGSDEIEQMALLGELAASVAHEIKNPLTVAMGYLEIIKRGHEHSTDETYKKALLRLDESLNRINKITSGITKMSYRGHIIMDRFFVESLIHQAIDHIGDRIERKGIKLELINKSPGVIEGHQIQLEQVLCNLINNALHALNGEVEKHLIIESSLEHGRAIIKVKNSGAPIPDDVASKLFHTTVTTKKIGEGTGLGLKICQQILEKHKGSIGYYREDNLTVFHIDLPLATSSGQLI